MMSYLEIPIEQIAVIDRAREDMGDLQALVEDMLAEEFILDEKRQRGQLQPGIVRRAEPSDKDKFGVDLNATPWILVAGGRRYNAVCMAGFDTYKAMDRGFLPPLERKIYELHENLLRKDLNWAEDVKLKAEIHELRKSQNDKHTQTDTGNELKESTANISRDLALAEEIKKNPALANAPTKMAAVNIVKTKRMADERAAKIREVPKAALAKRMIIADMHQFVRTIPTESVALSFLDIGRMPYEFDASEAIDEFKALEKHLDLVSDMLPQLARITKQTGWVVVIPGQKYYDETAKFLNHMCVAHLEYADDQIDCKSLKKSHDSPCRFVRVEDPAWILVTTNNAQPVRQPDIHVTNQYERICVVNMGNGALTQRHKSNVLSFPVMDEDDRLHPMQLNHDFCVELIQRLTVGGEKVADFGFGSGAFSAAAVSLQRDFIACDNDPATLDPAITLVSEHLPKR
jgi:ParB-like chromosome segregation protein Spo0J